MSKSQQPSNAIETAMVGKSATARYRGPKYNPQMEIYEKQAFLHVEAEYREDHIQSMKEIEPKTLPIASMIDIQPELKWYMRPYLLDFLVDTHLALKLSSQTLFLAVNIVDRYCSKRVVAKKHYQLVGCTALWIASKYQDKKSHIPSISELINMCCGVYEEPMFLQMEGHILNTLEWSIGHTTLDSYIYLYLGSTCNPALIYTARFLAEVSMYDKSFFQFKPSLLANCCVTLASHILDYCPLPASFKDPVELDCIQLLYYYMQTPSQSLQKKYMKSSYFQIPKIIASFITRQQASQIALPPSPAPSCDSVDYRASKTGSICSISSSASANQLNNYLYGVQSKSDKPTNYITPPCTPSPYHLNANSNHSNHHHHVSSSTGSSGISSMRPSSIRRSSSINSASSVAIAAAAAATANATATYVSMEIS